MTRLAAWCTREHWLIGASLTRVLLGVWAIYHYVLHFPVRGLLWGPDGIWPYERFVAVRPFLSVWQLSASPLFFEIIYIAAIGVAVAYTLGWWPRLLGMLHWWMIWSLQERNPFITDGGDNIMRIVLLFLVLVNTGAHFSVAGGRRSLLRLPLLARQALAVVHNVGVLLILAQVSMLYLSTGLYKAMGELWQNGTALYYILRVEEFSWPGVAEFIYRNPYLVVFGTYGTVLFEVLFLPSLFNRWLRYAMIAAGTLFHIGISTIMGLVTFGWSMLSIYPLLVTDTEYRSVTRWLRRRLEVMVLYDGWCPSCTRSVQWLAALDLFSLVDYLSFREPGVVQSWRVDVESAARRIQSIDAGGRRAEGMDAMICIVARIPLLWPVLPVFALCRLAAGQRAYDALAARRLILVPGHCAGHCAADGRPDARG